MCWVQTVSAWRACQPSVSPGFPKTSISNLRSGDSRLFCPFRTQLCTIRGLGFLLGCFPTNKSPLPDHLRTPYTLLGCFRSGVKTFTCRKSFFYTVYCIYTYHRHATLQHLKNIKLSFP